MSRDIEKTDTREQLEDLSALKHVDTVHDDQALKIIAAYQGADAEWTPEEEQKLVRKIDFKLVPLMFITYGLIYYDKSMLSSAALFGLRKDLALTGNRYSMSSSIFYLGAIAGALPAALLAQRFPVERVAAGLICLWGLNIILTIECTDFKTLYVNRFFLGFLEAGLSPMLMIIVASFYKKTEQPLRLGSWWSAAGFISMFAPLVNYGFGHVKAALSPWKYMYIFAGSLTVVWGIVILLFLPPEPIHAKGFTERERYIAVARLRVNNAGIRNSHLKPAQVLEALTDIKFWLVFFCAFCIMIANGPLSTYLPIIIAGFGYSPLNSLLLTMPAGFVAGTCTLLSTYLAGKLSRRGGRSYVVVLFQFLVILGALLMWRLPHSNKAGGLAGLYLLASFAAPYGVIMSLQAANTAGYTKKTVTSSGLFMGYCLGNFAGPLLFRPQDAPQYEPGWQAVVITAFIALGLIVAYRFVCVLYNKKRNEAGIAEGVDHAFEDDLTDLKVTSCPNSTSYSAAADNSFRRTSSSATRSK
ncbi:hypothetical protein PV08_07638 [Exophiala spinifera]|uniref:Major facilitator superfamily (MFS) profile domain-containing protein n=1 Tax=Exophiala spinifera TaxID=91928 RepID=A0A0D2B7F2_9EURO|nr:uncharacterized protein PV08_07638 [Exophiala spinifera]KIW14853.1 hypothetical protein PV08_07638 [Exophiala spinifera]